MMRYKYLEVKSETNRLCCCLHTPIRAHRSSISPLVLWHDESSVTVRLVAVLVTRLSSLPRPPSPILPPPLPHPPTPPSPIPTTPAHLVGTSVVHLAIGAVTWRVVGDSQVGRGARHQTVVAALLLGHVTYAGRHHARHRRHVTDGRLRRRHVHRRVGAGRRRGVGARRRLWAGRHRGVGVGGHGVGGGGDERQGIVNRLGAHQDAVRAALAEPRAVTHVVEHRRVLQRVTHSSYSLHSLDSVTHSTQ